MLLAVVDAKYRFRVVDMGAYGRNSDGGTLSASAFGAALRQNTLGIPADTPLPGAERLRPVPRVFLADEAFPSCRNIMRPYLPMKSVNLQVLLEYLLLCQAVGSFSIQRLRL